MFTRSEKQLNHGNAGGLIEPLKLQLTGSQINLVSRSSCKRPAIRRPTSASSIMLDYQEPLMRKASPVWSRPQSADGIHHISKGTRYGISSAALHCGDIYFANSDNYFSRANHTAGSLADLTASYTSSSKLIHNLVETSSSDDISVTCSPLPFDEMLLGPLRKSSAASRHSASIECLNKHGQIGTGPAKTCFEPVTNIFGPTFTAQKSVASSLEPGDIMNSSGLISTQLIFESLTNCSGTTKGECDSSQSGKEAKPVANICTDNRVSCDSNVMLDVNESSDRKTLNISSIIQGLEPGLASKPPLPPSPDYTRSAGPNYSCPTDKYNSENDDIDYYNEDEIVNLKFQRWFPRSVIKYCNRDYQINRSDLSVTISPDFLMEGCKELTNSSNENTDNSNIKVNKDLYCDVNKQSNFQSLDKQDDGCINSDSIIAGKLVDHHESLLFNNDDLKGGLLLQVSPDVSCLQVGLRNNLKNKKQKSFTKKYDRKQSLTKHTTGVFNGKSGYSIYRNSAEKSANNCGQPFNVSDSPLVLGNSCTPKEKSGRNFGNLIINEICDRELSDCSDNHNSESLFPLAESQFHQPTRTKSESIGTHFILSPGNSFSSDQPCNNNDDLSNCTVEEVTPTAAVYDNGNKTGEKKQIISNDNINMLPSPVIIVTDESENVKQQNVVVGLGDDDQMKLVPPQIESLENCSPSNYGHQEDSDGVVKQLIQTRLAVRSEYIIKTFKPVSFCNRMSVSTENKNPSADGSPIRINPEDSFDGFGIQASETNVFAALPQDVALADLPERDLDVCDKEVAESASTYHHQTSTYNDIVNILKILEREEQQDVVTSSEEIAIGIRVSDDADNFEKCNKESAERSEIINKDEDCDHLCVNKESIGGASLMRTAILNYLDESDKKCDEAVKIKSTLPITSVTSYAAYSDALMNGKNKITVNGNRLLQAFESSDDVDSPGLTCTSLTELLTMSVPELAQRVTFLTVQLEKTISELHTANQLLKDARKDFENYKNNNESTIRRHQIFINQLLNEKRTIAVRCSAVVKELEAKHLGAIKCMEENHKVQLKKACDKTAAAEKIKRDRWIDMKTKKIKELTVKGIEPELNRMAAAHQEELNELRRAHQRQLEEMEMVFNRRLADQRIQGETEKENAVVREREAARSRLEQEILELEKSYQDQRGKLLAEVRAEREQSQKENLRIIAEKESMLQLKLEKMSQEMLEKQQHQENCYKAQVSRMKSMLEAEKEAWTLRQKTELAEKEKKFKEECKRNRDKEIDLALKRLETEMTRREKLFHNKLRKEKEQYEVEMKEMEKTEKELRAKVKETKQQIISLEEKNAQTICQLNKSSTEYLTFQQAMEKQMTKKDASICCLEDELKRKSVVLKEEIGQARIEFQQQLSKVLCDKESELQKVFDRVKEAIAKKDETIASIEKQRDTAIQRCSHLEYVLKQERSDQHRKN